MITRSRSQEDFEERLINWTRTNQKNHRYSLLPLMCDENSYSDDLVVIKCVVGIPLGENVFVTY